MNSSAIHRFLDRTMVINCWPALLKTSLARSLAAGRSLRKMYAIGKIDKTRGCIRSSCPDKPNGCQQAPKRSHNQTTEVIHGQSQGCQAACCSEVLPCLDEKRAEASSLRMSQQNPENLPNSFFPLNDILQFILRII